MFEVKLQKNGQTDGHENYFRHIYNCSFVSLFSFRIQYLVIIEIQITEALLYIFIYVGKVPKFDRESKTNGQKDGHKNYFRHICNSSLVYLYGLRIIHPVVAEIQITQENGKGYIQNCLSLIESQRQTDRRTDIKITLDTSAILH